ncbi:hypothetical protein B0J11DRAFT_251580 [Dendryphion nanum]|uniref:Extracellular membrane protein CFEM domain-containing protein n=1 Tax=Dendryphion nanum TaxID=256645 RepID=A0A9P9E485_9PLEO|nr:hypothetical protein B0J11DRAFT_251580 [Dendryphion nanum]
MLRTQLLSIVLLFFTAVCAQNPLFIGYTSRCQKCLDDLHAACSKTKNVAECICMLDGNEGALDCANGVCAGDSDDCSRRFKFQWQAYCLKELPQWYGSLVTSLPTALPTCAPPTGSASTSVPASTTRTGSTSSTPTPSRSASSSAASSSSSVEQESSSQQETSTRAPSSRSTTSPASATAATATARAATTSPVPSPTQIPSAANALKQEIKGIGHVIFVLPSVFAIGFAIVAFRGHA